ncbi:MAG TPA: hypothetical protein VGJ81_04220 [Thermoanaerobaculia bacterium]
MLPGAVLLTGTTSRREFAPNVSVFAASGAGAVKEPSRALRRGGGPGSVTAMTPNETPNQTAVIAVAVVSLVALLLLATGTSPGAVKDILAIVLPPLVAMATRSSLRDRA